MRLGHYLRRIRELPPGEIARRARNKAEDRIRATLGRWVSYRRPTYSVRAPEWLSRGLSRHFLRMPARGDGAAIALCRALAEKYLSHRFNLLGSGWTEVRHGMACRGLEGRAYPPGPAVAADRAGKWLEGRVNAANLAESRRIWSLVREGYVPIDWHLDFKSGYRWPEGVFHRDIPYGSVPGSDVKVPWELSRMQHLAQLALAFRHASAGVPGFASPDDYAREFRDQILDFIACNPPGFGVNWACAMDVGIRVSNWLACRDLLLCAGARLDAAFESVFARSVYEHGRHIIRNLEWSSGLRGNHYLADICGLAFVAAFLPRSAETDAWLFFSVRELGDEARIQFHPDGSNFEASTCYHRLSAEMLGYATALILSVPAARMEGVLGGARRHMRFLPRFAKPLPPDSHALPDGTRIPFSPSHLERLERAAEFAQDITRPDGHVLQVGDNDSGRFLKLFPIRRPRADGGDDMEEDFLDFRHLVAALNGFFGRKDLEAFAGEASAETEIMEGILGGRRVPSFRGGVSRGAGMPVRYPDFGLFLWTRPGFYLAFRCGPIGQLDNGGHAHNDQLSFELSVGGVSMVEDPGAYLYTPDWDHRNRFRSTASHNTLGLEGREQDPWENTRPGLFRLISRSRAEVLEVGEDRARGRHHGFGPPHERTLRLGRDRIEGEDRCEAGGPRAVSFHFSPDAGVSLSADGGGVEASRGGASLRIHGGAGTWSLEEGLSSPAYGVARKAMVARLKASGPDPLKWYIDWPLPEG